MALRGRASSLADPANCAATAVAIVLSPAAPPSDALSDTAVTPDATEMLPAVVPLARSLPGWSFAGVENAPLTWLAGRLRSLGQGNLAWRWGDLWHADLAGYGVVYAFLSPAPMAALWDKVRAEMRPGTLFISNSFAVPDAAPGRVVEIPGTPPRRLYLYEIAAG